MLCEVRVFSRRYHFAGTLDALGMLNREGALLDYKTGNPRDVAADLQTAAYYGAFMEMRANGDRAEMLEFDEAQHAYFLDGVRMPSVTGILQRAGLVDFSHLPADVRERALQRGRAVHQAIHFYNEGDLDTTFRDEFPDCWPYVAGWLRFLDDTRFEIAADEGVLGDLLHVRRFSVQLRRDGTYAVERYGDPRDYSEFLALLQAQHIAARRRPRVHAEDFV